MPFDKFAEQVKNQFNEMSQHQLYRVSTTKGSLWEVYMNSFPAGTNEIYRERRTYECNHCHNFIRDVGNVVAIIDGKLISVWDVEPEGYYKDVVKAMSAYIKSLPIQNFFLNKEPTAGRESNQELLPDQSVKTWKHFNCTIPTQYVERDIATKLGQSSTFQALLKRGLETISISSMETVRDLINSNSIYRGEEHKERIEQFLSLKSKFDLLQDNRQKEIFIWSNLKSNPSAGIRNSVIGSLLIDISEGKDISEAVASFESKVAPSNYKRTSAVVTPKMIEQGLKELRSLDLESALQRRFAVSTDISINNVLFADRGLEMADKDPLLGLLTSNSAATKVPKTLPEISIENFLKDVVPTATSIEALVTNSLTSKLTSLIAPVDSTASNILQWGNNFSWSYNGDVTDSMKERVKKAGGSITGVLRFSIQWNEKLKDRNNDLDAHCNLPGAHIYFSSSNDYNSKGSLDIDIQSPGSETAVENITWPTLSSMPNGNYDFYVKNFSGTNTEGFRAEIEFDGQLYSFNYSQRVTKDVPVATVTLKDGQFTIKPNLPTSTTSKEVWGIPTEKFSKVSTVMYSPNHWDGEKTGNKHYFFMLDDCKNPNTARGLYNEFLANSLQPKRKLFDLIGSKLLCPKSDNQLSGLGFSSTVRSELIVKITNGSTKLYKIKF